MVSTAAVGRSAVDKPRAPSRPPHTTTIARAAMSTEVYPTQDPSSALNEEHKVSILELAWLLSDLSVTVRSLSSGFRECLALLQPDQSGSTLVLSSNRSEALKGFVVRVGKNITKAEINLKLQSLNKGQVCNLMLSEGKSIPLAQLSDCANFLAVCSRIVDEMDFVEPAVVLSQLRKLLNNIRYAHISIRTVSQAFQFPYSSIDHTLFTPEIPESVAIDLTISESGVIADIRTLQAVEPPAVNSSGSSARSRFSTASSLAGGGSSGAASIFRSGSSQSVMGIAGARQGSITPRSMPPGTLSALTQTSQASANPPPASASSSSAYPSELTRTTTNVSTASSVNSTMSNMSTASTSSWIGSILGRRKTVDPANLFFYKGQYVKALERITVQSLDPGLMALISKLNVLELNIGQVLRKLEIAMNWK
ncbi:RAVE subunit 2/Rogdi [Limtongia smithiae]|uniref:RAVE subunit 2/Rogdi n=1 Tax=Limtongia smithiae TaxID=1125753 RepID=UPI0034D00392